MYTDKCHTKQSSFLGCSESDISLLTDLKEPSLSLHCHWNICACACAHVCQRQRQLHKYPLSPSNATFFQLCVTEVSVRSSSLSLTFLCHFCYTLHTNYINDYITISTTLLTHYNLRWSEASFHKGSVLCRWWLLRWPVLTAILPNGYLNTLTLIAW